MKKIIIYLGFLFPVTAISQSNYKLWYQEPAKVWTEALPVGNGRLGAMVFGNEKNELIQLNESTLWSGGPVTNNINPDAPKYLSQIREAIFAGDYAKAASLSKKMQGVYSESFLPLGDLMIKQDIKSDSSTSYYRDLDIKDAVSTTKFKMDGVNYTRQVFFFGTRSGNCCKNNGRQTWQPKPYSFSKKPITLSEFIDWGKYIIHEWKGTYS